MAPAWLCKSKLINMPDQPEACSLPLTASLCYGGQSQAVSTLKARGAHSSWERDEPLGTACPHKAQGLHSQKGS